MLFRQLKIFIYTIKTVVKPLKQILNSLKLLNLFCIQFVKLLSNNLYILKLLLLQPIHLKQLWNYFCSVYTA